MSASSQTWKDVGVGVEDGIRTPVVTPSAIEIPLVVEDKARGPLYRLKVASQSPEMSSSIVNWYSVDRPILISLC